MFFMSFFFSSFLSFSSFSSSSACIFHAWFFTAHFGCGCALKICSFCFGCGCGFRFGVVPFAPCAPLAAFVAPLDALCSSPLQAAFGAPLAAFGGDGDSELLRGKIGGERNLSGERERSFFSKRGTRGSVSRRGCPLGIWHNKDRAQTNRHNKDRAANLLRHTSMYLDSLSQY